MSASEGSLDARNEWAALRKLFGTQRLAGLLGISESSVWRYAEGKRPTPGPVAARMRWLTRVIEHLSGPYNEEGVRSWFARSRQALDGHSPQGLLRHGGAWSLDGAPAHRIEALVKASTGMTAT